MFLKTVFCLAVFGLGVAHADSIYSPRIENLAPALVDVTPVRVFAPLGFDDNDNAQVVLDGELSDTCYKLGPTKVRVDHEAKKVFVRQQAYFYAGDWCAEVRIPYVQTVDLGILKSGQYDVVVETNDVKRSFTMLPIAVATSPNPDDYLYAPLTGAHLEHGLPSLDGSDKKEFNLVLSGYFSNSCMKFSTVKLNLRTNGVIEVLPIVEMQKPTVGCAQVTTEFNVSVPLTEVAHGRYLLHIRSLNGQSINKVADL